MKNSAIGRRRFMQSSLVAAVAGGAALSHPARAAQVPGYLKDYANTYANDPRQAAQDWFKDAKFGLFMHYGLYSILGRHEWVQLRETIPLREYMKLKDQFTARDFDTDFIADLACEAGMKYITITTKHHEGFSLFATKENDYHAMASPAQRDLIGELADSCNERGLGLFLYYSYAADWKHPYFYPPDAGWVHARPKNWKDEVLYRWQKDEDFAIYVDFVHSQLKEMLSSYGPIAGIWFDPIMGYYARPDLFPIDETYALIRRLQPQTLISFKQGATGTEDFAAPERSGHSLADRVKQTFPDNPASYKAADIAWESNKSKWNEICDTLQPAGWGYIKADDGKHKPPEHVIDMLAQAESQRCNLLLNTGPLPQGGIHREDVQTLKEVGRRLRTG